MNQVRSSLEKYRLKSLSYKTCLNMIGGPKNYSVVKGPKYV